MSKIFRGERGR